MTERKIFKAVIDINELPEPIGKVLKILSDEKQLVVKGGFAKAIFEWCLLRNGEKPRTNALRSLLNNNTDLDIVFIFFDKEDRDMLTEKFDAVQAKLAAGGVELLGSDVEIIRNKRHLNDDGFAEKIFSTRDLTINEVVVISSHEKDKWTLYCTDVCYRDTLNGVGVLSGNTKSTVWYSAGRMVPTNHGLFRLLKFLIDGKVKKIYLPQWWVDINISEAQRQGHNNLGAYGLLLAQKYADKPELAQKMMSYFNSLRIEESSDFKEYMHDQENSFQNSSNMSFDFNPDRPFKDVLQHYRDKEDKRVQKQHARRINREECDHYMEMIECDKCKMNCKIEECIKCKLIKTTPSGWDKPIDDFKRLLCNYNWKYAKVYWDKEGFFPREPKQDRK